MVKFKEGDVCAVCNVAWEQGRQFIEHHATYDPEVTFICCKPCHNWMHASSKVFKHPLKKRYGRGMAPLAFAQKVVSAYQEALFATFAEPD